MYSMNLFIPITKVDEEKRLVYGIATQEVLDKANEIMDYESSKPNFEKWSKEIEKASGGKSLGNVREMHSNKAAGKLTQLNFNDDGKAIEVCAKVVDNDSWSKVLEGVLTGFSIGGSYMKRWKDDSGATRYTADPSEISLVDNPCCPTATFEVIKADGVIEQRKFFKGSENGMEPERLKEIKKAFAEKDLAKAFSFEEITARLQSIIQEKVQEGYYGPMPPAYPLCDNGMGVYVYIVATYPDSVIVASQIDNDSDTDMFRIQYTMTDDGVITLGDIQQVHAEYVPVKDEDGEDATEELQEILAEKSIATDELKKLLQSEEGISLLKTEIGKIAQRKDISEADKKRAEEKYGNVAYADEKNKKYPIDTEEHIRAAWNYINKEKNAAKYSEEDLKTIKSKIIAAWKEKIDKDGPPSADDTKKAVDGDLSELQKIGVQHSKETLAKLMKIHHDIAEMGGACKCDKCMKLYKEADGADNTAKAAQVADLHKSHTELAKVMEGMTTLQKAYESLRADYEALQEQVKKLGDTPMPGGPILNGSVVMSKTLPGGLPNATASASEIEILKKMRDEESDPMVKQAISQKIAILEVKQVQKVTSL